MLRPQDQVAIENSINPILSVDNATGGHNRIALFTRPRERGNAPRLVVSRFPLLELLELLGLLLCHLLFGIRAAPDL
jgi:hypothetical protein